MIASILAHCTGGLAFARPIAPGVVADGSAHSLQEHAVPVEGTRVGDLRLVSERRDGRELVFAFLPSGQAVWAMDAVSRQEWWYAPELAPAVLPDLRRALLERPPATQAPAPIGPGADLSVHRPGHAVLAEIEAQHRSATASVIDGMAGTLEEGIVHWCVGYVGEAEVGRELERLGPSWHVLHGVPVGTRGSDIDHVVIGPAGVFTINTKHHAGANVDVKGDAVFVGRDHQHYIRNARHEASRARSAAAGLSCSPRIHPLVVTVGANLRIKQAPVDVGVLDSRALVAWLLDQRPSLSDARISEVYEHLRWSERWTESLPPAAAAPWVEGFARQMATEQAVARTVRRRHRGAAGGHAPSHPTPAGGRASNGPGRAQRRRRGVSVRQELVRLAVGILLFAFLVTAGPTILNRIASAFTPKGPVMPSATATAGAACTTRGAQAVSASGARLVCAPGPGSSTLVWRTPKP